MFSMTKKKKKKLSTDPSNREAFNGNSIKKVTINRNIILNFLLELIFEF